MHITHQIFNDTVHPMPLVGTRFHFGLKLVQELRPGHDTEDHQHDDDASTRNHTKRHHIGSDRYPEHLLLCLLLDGWTFKGLSKSNVQQRQESNDKQKPSDDILSYLGELAFVPRCDKRSGG